MNKSLLWLALSILAALAFSGCRQTPVEWNVVSGQLPIADPFILLHDGVYHAYGTGEDGFRVYSSTDLEHWVKKGIALDMDKSWGTKWFWAPEVYYIPSKGKFFLFYSSEEHICVATSDSPEGPFTQSEIKPIREEQGIDTSLFIDDDGKAYLYFVRFTGGNVIWVAEMKDDLLGIKEETLTQCVAAEEPWETIQGRVAEGPSVLKIKGIYYLLYSANDYKSKDYAVGYATSSSPFGPWTKYSGNPILRRGNPIAAGLVGTGHGAPFKSADGKLMYVFHAHQNDTTIHPRITLISKELRVSKDGTLSMEGDLIRPVIVDTSF